MLTQGGRRLLAGLVVAVALLLIGRGGWVQAKAQLAQWLLLDAWQRTLQEGVVHKAWPWADHWPIGRLTVPARSLSQVVLEGDGGNVLAFAPGHNPRSAMPGQPGPIVLSGHRDTHFGFLRSLAPGDRLELETRSGVSRYPVTGSRVVDARTTRIDAGWPGNPLLLVTCYPFDALSVGGPLRYVVEAEPVDR